MNHAWRPTFADNKATRATAEQLLDLLDHRPRTVAEFRVLLSERGIQRSPTTIRNALTQLVNSAVVCRTNRKQRFAYSLAENDPEAVRRRMTKSEADALRAAVVCDGLLAHSTGDPLGSTRTGSRRACSFRRCTLERLAALRCLQLRRRGRRHRWVPTELGRAVAELGR